MTSEHEAELLLQLKAELSDRRRSLAFWEGQPPTEVQSPPAFMVDVRSGRIQSLKAEIVSVKQAIEVLEHRYA